MKRWEYRFESEVSRDRLNELGEEGWELLFGRIGLDYGDDEEHSGLYLKHAILVREKQ